MLGCDEGGQDCNEAVHDCDELMRWRRRFFVNGSTEDRGVKG